MSTLSRTEIEPGVVKGDWWHRLKAGITWAGGMWIRLAVASSAGCAWPATLTLSLATGAPTVSCLLSVTKVRGAFAVIGGVYKLVPVRHGGEWRPAIKISESPSKTPNPGYKHIWRLYDQVGKATADLLSLDDEDPQQTFVSLRRTTARIVLRHPSDHTKYRVLDQPDLAEIEPLLVDVLRDGKLVYELPSIEEIRQRREADLNRLDPGVRRLTNPHIYHVSLTHRLWDLKQSLIEAVKVS